MTRGHVAGLVSAAALVSAHAVAAGQAPAARPPDRHVILVTIDGLRGDYIGADDRYHLKIPTLRRLMREGATSERTLSVFPSLTGPAHTSLVTGTTVCQHGILGNNRFDPSVWGWADDAYDRQPPYREHALIKAPTLWSAVKAKGWTSAAVSWPQTVNGPIDYRLDLSVAATGAEAQERTRRSASPGWLDKIEAKLGPLAPLDVRMSDHLKALVAAEILRQFRPAFMAVHFSLTDAVQHANGPGTLAALSAMEVTDQNLGTLVAGIADAGLADRAIVIVTGDHGFLPMHTQLAINLPLVEAGLIRHGAADRPEWTAIVAPNRGLGSLYVKDPRDQAVVAKARAALETYAARYPRRFRLLDRSELDRLGADGEAVLGIEPYEGYVLDARLSPPFAMPHGRAAGHGYRPDLPGMETGLIVWGAGVRPGVVLPMTSTIDVAPTIAAMLGLELPDADGRPIVGVLKP